jgi:hypothetical protein
VFSQVIFEDDFDGSGPGLAGWSLYNEDGNTPNTNVDQFTDAWIQADDFDNAGDIVAQSTSWYTPAGQSDDWMVTPVMNFTGLTGDPILTWEAESQDATYLESYEVRVSTTGNTVADFVDAPVFTTTTTSGGVFTAQSVNLNSYAGNATVYIAWRNISTDKFILLINNVKVEMPAAFDVSITSAGETQDQYTQIPLEQIAPIGTNATIINIQGAVTNAVATVTVNDGVTDVYTASSAPFAIAAGASQPVTFTGFTPTAVGTYTTTYTVSIAETDGVPSNNTVSTNVTEVTANTYARDDNTITNALGIGSDNGGYLGQEFDITEIENILSVTFAINNTSGEITGLPVRATVWDMVAGVPNTIIAQTDFVTVTATPNDLYTANITGGPFTLAPGTYLVAVEEPDTAGGMPLGESVQIATTTTIFTPGTTWVDWPTNPIGTWANNEDLGISVSYLIRPNFQDDTLTVETFNSETILIGLFPNPAKDVVTISNPNGVSLQKVTIIDVTGRVVKTVDLGSVTANEKTINVSSLNSATYFVTIQSSNGAVTKKLIIN